MILPDDDDVDAVIAGPHTLVRLAGPKAGVEVQFLAERDVDAAEPVADRSGNGALDGHLVPADGRKDRLGQRRPRRLDDALAGVLDVPVERHAGGLEHTTGRFGNLGPGTISGNQGDFVGQLGTVLSS